VGIRYAPPRARQVPCGSASLPPPAEKDAVELYVRTYSTILWRIFAREGRPRA
jgi:hypothetical protein